MHILLRQIEPLSITDQNHFALQIEEETKDNLSETLNIIKSFIYSLHELFQKF